MKRSARTLAVAILVLALVALGGVLAAGCGGSEKEAKADLSTALVELQAATTNLLAQGGTLTVGDYRKTRPLDAPLEKLIQAGENTPGVDLTAFQPAFEAWQQAGHALPDDLTIAAAMIQLTPVNLPLLDALKTLEALAAP